MPTEVKKEIQLEVAHVLFIDIVGYSKLSINEQRAVVDELTTIVRGSDQYQKAEAADRLIKIPTGDGMALVFYTTQEEAQGAGALGGHDDSAGRTRGNRRWHRNIFPLWHAIDTGCAGKEHRRASVRELERRQSERLLCRRHPGRDFDALIQDRRFE